MEKGYVQIYTGDGKGKTTAAIGQAIRAAGNGYNVLFIQFLKDGSSSEVNIIKDIKGIDYKTFEKKRDFFWNLSSEEKLELKEEINVAYEYIKNILDKKEYDVIILDEIFGVLTNGLLDEKALVEIIQNKYFKTELILTGRNALNYKNIIEIVDLITEMKLHKHYFNSGVSARKGIEY